MPNTIICETMTSLLTSQSDFANSQILAQDKLLQSSFSSRSMWADLHIRHTTVPYETRDGLKLVQPNILSYLILSHLISSHPFPSLPFSSLAFPSLPKIYVTIIYIYIYGIGHANSTIREHTYYTLHKCIYYNSVIFMCSIQYIGIC